MSFFASKKLDRRTVLRGAGVSMAVVVAGVLMLLTGWAWLDPAASLIVVIVIMFATWHLLRDSLDLVFDAVPPEIEPAAVIEYFQQLPGVFSIHDLHIWPLSTTETALTVHIVIPEGKLDDRLLYRINIELRERFNIGHATVQVERGNVLELCDQRHEHRVGRAG